MSDNKDEIQPVPDSGGCLPPEGRLAGIDFGTVRIGIATCDPSQHWVTPYETYSRRKESLDAEYFRQLAQEESLCGWVVGLPIHCDGKESQKSKEAREFCKWLKNVTKLPFVLYDERFTTREARRLLDSAPVSAKQKKRRVDGLAAHLILSHYLDNERAKAEFATRKECRESPRPSGLDDS